MQEKRTTTDAAQDNEENAAKRRLLRAGSRIQGRSVVTKKKAIVCVNWQESEQKVALT